jgi:hypothetical protein
MQMESTKDTSSRFDRAFLQRGSASWIDPVTFSDRFGFRHHSGFTGWMMPFFIGRVSQYLDTFM